MYQIIYLNGASSAGKTTLAKALQKHFKEPFLRLGIDQVIDMMPSHINDFQGGVAPEGFSWAPCTDPTGHDANQIQAGPFAQRICQTFKDLVVLLSQQQYNLIIDDVSFGKAEVDQWREALSFTKVLYVKVTAPLQILEEREEKRKDRLIGGARDQYFRAHEGVEYDLEIDTHALSEKMCIDLIVKSLGRLL